MPMAAIPRQELLVSVGSAVNMVAHASLMRNADAKPPNVSPITILTVTLRLTSSDR
jgi:hypothetical protein